MKVKWNWACLYLIHWLQLLVEIVLESKHCLMLMLSFSLFSTCEYQLYFHSPPTWRHAVIRLQESKEALFYGQLPLPWYQILLANLLRKGILLPCLVSHMPAFNGYINTQPGGAHWKLKTSKKIQEIKEVIGLR